MEKLLTGILDETGREIREGDTIENIAIRDVVVFRDGRWTTERNADSGPLEALLPVKIIS